MNNLIEEKVKEICEQFLDNEVWQNEVLSELKMGNADFTGLKTKLKTSLNEVVEATKKEYEEKYNKYRTGLLEELEELGYNKDAIKKREKEILEGIEKLDIDIQEWGREVIGLEDIKKIINKE
jgi:hypothetical protein